MENKNDWKEIESYIDNKDMHKINKYKMDIDKEYNKMFNSSKKKIKGKLIFTILALILAFYIFNDIFKINANQKRISIIEQSLHANVQEIPIKVNWFENGLYSYKIEDYPNEEIHAVFVSYKNIFMHDANDRLHKYYFENWKDEDRNKFVIDEHYEDCKHGFIKQEKWLLVYETYIETETYEDIIKATDIIIKYNNYIGNKMYIGSNVYIKYKDSIIKPIQASEMSEDLIRNNTKQMYNYITKK